MCMASWPWLWTSALACGSPMVAPPTSTVLYFVIHMTRRAVHHCPQVYPQVCIFIPPVVQAHVEGEALSLVDRLSPGVPA